jgi:hypothetical protein
LRCDSMNQHLPSYIAIVYGPLRGTAAIVGCARGNVDNTNTPGVSVLKCTTV